MGRASCCSGEGIKRGSWTVEEDRKLKAYIESHGEGGWRSLPLKAGLERCGKSCRLRWTNYLKPGIKRGSFTPQEDQTILKLHEQFGNRWAAIARELPMRTDNEIKNYWNAHLKKRGAIVDSTELRQAEDGGATDDDELETPPPKKPARSSSAQLLNRLATRVTLVKDCLARQRVLLRCHSTSEEEKEEEERSPSATTARWWCDQYDEMSDVNGNYEGPVGESSKSEKDDCADLKNEDAESRLNASATGEDRGRLNHEVVGFPEFGDNDIDDFLFGMGSPFSDFTFLED